MKHILSVLFLLFFSTVGAYETLVEVKASYFHPTNGMTRKIYHDSGIYGIETTWLQKSCLHPWASLSFLPTSGHSIGLNEKTNLFMMPIELGWKYIQPGRRVDLYVAAGAVAAYTRICDESGTEKRRRKWGGGGAAKVGVLYPLTNCSFLDAFIDYRFVGLKYCGNETDDPRTSIVSGVSIGLGMGTKF